MQNQVPIQLLLSLLAIILISLIIEAILHNRRVKAIPLRISVSGTRGKTTVVRMLASILRESGMRVLAKTTGTEAMYILPDGREEKVRRFGLTNILEQKAFIRKAARSNAECIVAEIMSIQAENHWVESQKLVQPHYTILTNFRTDHLDAVGKGDMSRLYLNDIHPRSTLVLPAKEMTDDLRKELQKTGVKIVLASSKAHSDQNQELAQTLATELEISSDCISKGISNSKMDSGEVSAYEFIRDDKRIVFVSSFAANDPASSQILMDKVKQKLDLSNPEVIALLSFRMDRGERSQQWLDYLQSGHAQQFERMFYMGAHGQIFKRKLQRGELIRMKKPDEISRHVMNTCNRDTCSKDTIVFGLVNIHKQGLELVKYWEKSGRKIDLFNKSLS
ncbi:MAG: poly-gamma-glutamate synthase PgsB [Bacteroidota bacterium]|nr:poly-gamma-glutamate synthase PgsB [Bacteroidota bacterium]